MKQKVPSDSYRSTCLEFRQFGRPSDVLQCVEKECESNLPLLLRVLYSPINPADLNLIEGTYGTRPELPAVPGIEGVAEVVQSEDPTFPIGAQVLCPPGPGAWSAFRPADSADCILVPEGVPVEQAAMARVNPPTAWRMLHDFVSLDHGEWVAFNAATSGVGISLIQIGQQLGLKTMAFARNPDSLARLLVAGATAAFQDHETGVAAARELLGKQAPRLVLNAVGGDSALRLCGLLARSGTMVTYGAMGRKALKIPNSLQIFRDLRFRGFWLSRWFRENDRAGTDPMWQTLFEWMRLGNLAMPVQSVHTLEDFQLALEANSKAGRTGKVLFQPTAT